MGFGLRGWESIGLRIRRQRVRGFGLSIRGPCVPKVCFGFKMGLGLVNEMGLGLEIEMGLGLVLEMGLGFRFEMG